MGSAIGVVSRLGRGDILHRAAAVARGLLQKHISPGARRAPCLVVGHRGAAKYEAENTVAAFRRALELGADTVETDVSVTADGRFALWHDADPDEKVALARQLGGEDLAWRPKVPGVGSRWRRPVRELTADELARHYRYVAKDGGAEASFAWLEDLLAWTREARVAHLCVDIKLMDDQAPAAASLVSRLRRDGPPATTFHLLSPSGSIVRALAAACEGEPSSRFRVSADLELPAPEVTALAQLGAGDVSLGLGGRLWAGYRYDVGWMLEARDAGRFGTVICWTHNDPRRLQTLVAARVDGILTDEPAILRRLVREETPALESVPA